MSRLHTSLIGLFCALVLSTSASALPATSSARAELFAICSGRLEALATRQRALESKDLDSTIAMQEQFDLLLETVLPSALMEGVDTQEPKRWRVRGWVEIAYLLADVDYSFDARITQVANRQLGHRIAECRKVVL